MRLTILGSGTSQGVLVIACDCEVCSFIHPKDKRSRSSILLETGGKTIVIDTGPDFRMQMLRENVKDLDAVVYTHEHKDHVAGMDDIRAFNFKKGGGEMNIYASMRVQKALHREFHYIFSGIHYPGLPQVKFHTIKNQEFKVAGVQFTPIEVLHYQLPVLGFRVGDMAYITDANYISEKEKMKLKGLEVLVLNALRKKKHISHFNLEEALALITELKPKKAYLTHISHLMGKHAEVEKELPKQVFLAYDGLKISI